MTFNAKSGAVAPRNEGGNTMLPCDKCKRPTEGMTLSLYGARCKLCYDAYCGQSVADFNRTFKRDEPQLAMPRVEREVTTRAKPDTMQSIGAAFTRPEPPAYTDAELTDMRRANEVRGTP